MKILKLSRESLRETIKKIEGGGVVVFPTDTVYGLICDAINKKAVEKIFKIKKREKNKVLPIFVSSIRKAKEIATISKKQEEILKRYWPGKYTFILKSKIKNSKEKFYRLITKKDDKIGIRIPNYKELNDLLKKMKTPLAQTSANISNFPATTKIEEVINYFKDKKDKPDLIIDAGNLKKSKSSKVIDLAGKSLTRIR